MAPRVLTADRGDAGRRLDLVLRRHLTDVEAATRTRVQVWIDTGLVAVNGRPVRRVAARAALGDLITVALPAATPRAPMAAESAAISVLYEDAQFLAVNKPAGLVVHPTHAHASGTLMNALLWHARGWPATSRPSLVGRLDKGTSGVVVVAKGAAMHAALQRAWGGAGTIKEYLALVYGRVTPAKGRIDLGLRRDPGDRRRVIASDRSGAPSVTLFERIGRPGHIARRVSLVRCRLLTGRTHQIRVHLAARGWPIVGDPVYGAPGWRGVEDPVLRGVLRRFPGQALHAWRTVLPHPLTGRPVEIVAPLPPDFHALVAATGIALDGDDGNLSRARGQALVTCSQPEHDPAGGSPDPESCEHV